MKQGEMRMKTDMSEAYKAINRVQHLPSKIAHMTSQGSKVISEAFKHLPLDNNK